MAPRVPRAKNVPPVVRSLMTTVNQPTYDLPRMTFTFGVEIEFLFIVRRAISADKNHPLYLSDFDVTDDGFYRGRPEDIPERDLATLRALRQTQRILESRIPHCEGIQVFLRTPDGNPYEKWHLTPEGVALTGSLPGNLSRWTGGHINHDNWLEWELFGQELVSRILTVPDPDSRQRSGNDLMEVSTYFDELQRRQDQNDDYYTISEVENSGLHVHIGLPVASGGLAEDFNLKFCQHLAFILIEYEHVISSLHHPQRRGFYGTKTDYIAQSNRLGILGHRHSCGLYPLPILSAVRDVIFAPDMTIEKLATLMDDAVDSAPRATTATHIDVDPDAQRTRYKFVNWENLIRPSLLNSRWASVGNDDKSRQGGRAVPVKQTIEFRQHHGTSQYTSDVGPWLNFIFSLVRAAETKARYDVSPAVSPSSPTASKNLGLKWSIQQVRKYPDTIRYLEEGKMLEGLFDLLDLSRTSRAYWRLRYQGYDAESGDRDGTRVADQNWYRACRECALGKNRHQELSNDINLLSDRVDRLNHEWEVRNQAQQARYLVWDENSRTRSSAILREAFTTATSRTTRSMINLNNATTDLEMYKKAQRKVQREHPRIRRNSLNVFRQMEAGRERRRRAASGSHSGQRSPTRPKRSRRDASTLVAGMSALGVGTTTTSSIRRPRRPSPTMMSFGPSPIGRPRTRRKADKKDKS